jgi:hypothetical protein
MGIYFLRPVTREKLHDRAGGQCECTMEVCGHAGQRCPGELGDGWQVHRKTAGGISVLSNVLAMCRECHERTQCEG